MNLRMPEVLSDSIQQGGIHGVHSQLVLRLKVPLLNTICAKEDMVVTTSPSLCSLDCKLGDNDLYLMGML